MSGRKTKLMMKSFEEAWMELQPLTWELHGSSGSCIGQTACVGVALHGCCDLLAGPQSPNPALLLLSGHWGAALGGQGTPSFPHAACARHPSLLLPDSRKVIRLLHLGPFLCNHPPKINMFKRKIVSSHPSSKSFLL